MCANKLSINTSKTKYIIFHHRQTRNLPKLDLKMDGQEITQTTEFDFLGLSITSTLDWSKHISKIANKISQTIGTMSRIKRYVPTVALKSIYNSLVLSRLYYCILLWGFDSSRLFKLQKRAVRIICRSKYNAHTDPLFQDLALLKIKDIFAVQCATFFFKFNDKTLPGYFSIFFQTNENIHSHHTRNRASLHLFQYRFKSTGKCIKFHIPNYINNLPNAVREKIYTHSLSGFTNYIKRYLIGNYERQCNIANCHVCQNS
jgi:hypothetical protein